MDETLAPPRKRRRVGNSNGPEIQDEFKTSNNMLLLRQESDAKVRKVYVNNKPRSSTFQINEPIVAKETAVLMDPLTNMRNDRKMHRIKLRSQDGKDLGHVNLFMQPEEAKSLNGRTIKLAKLNTINEFKDSLVGAKVPEEGTINYQLAPTRKKEIVPSNVIVIPPKEAEKKMKYIQKDIAFQTKENPNEIGKNRILFAKSAPLSKSNLQKIQQTGAGRNQVIVVNKQLEKYKDVSPIRKKMTLTGITSQTIIPPQKRKVIVVGKKLAGEMQQEIKVEDGIFIDLRRNSTDENSNDVLNKTEENNHEPKVIRIMNHSVKGLADENPVLASFLKNPTNSSSEENIIKEKDIDTKKESLSVIEKAMNSISDINLREQALKALAECGLRVTRQVPIIPEEPTRILCETQAQTEVFGLLDKECFIMADEKCLDLKRIPQRIEKISKANVDASVQVEPNNFEPSIPMADIPVLCLPETSQLNDGIDIISFFNSLSSNNDEVSKVKNILSKQDQRITETLAAQLRRDFDSIKMYGDDGMLGIHRAVIDNNPAEVRRLLLMLKACQEDANVETANGMTCLELAISSEASPEIVSALLKAGASPLSPRLVHDSPIILASKQSSRHLKELVAYVKDPFLLNLTGPEGFSALHYCAMLGNLDGIKLLLDAGANVNMRDSRSGRTALFHAIENNHVKISSLLYEKGATVTTPNFSGQTVLSLLQETSNSRLKKTFSQAINLNQRS